MKNILFSLNFKLRPLEQLMHGDGRAGATHGVKIIGTAAGKAWLGKEGLLDGIC